MAIRNAVTCNIILLVLFALVSVSCSRPGNRQPSGTGLATLDVDFSRNLESAEFINNSNYYVEVELDPWINRGTDGDTRTRADSFRLMVPPTNVSGGKAFVYFSNHTRIPDGFKVFSVNVSRTDNRAKLEATELCRGGRGITTKVGWSDREADRPANVEGQSYTRTVGGLTVTVDVPPADEAGLMTKAKKKLSAVVIQTVTWERDTDGLKFTKDCMATAGTIPHFVSGNITYGQGTLIYGTGLTIRGLTLSGGGRNVKIQCGEEAIQGQLLATLDGSSSNNETEEPLDPGPDFNAWITDQGDNMAPDQSDAQVCTQGAADSCACQASEY